MWSLGCTAIELFIKTPIFPGKYDYDQMLKILEFCGMPPNHMVYNSINRDRFFLFDQFNQRFVFKNLQQFVMTSVPPEMRHNVEVPQQYHPFLNFGQLLEQWHIQKLKMEGHSQYGIPERLKIFQFIDFVQQILQIDPQKRLTPLQALHHPFITGDDSAQLPFISVPD